jgi:hypothetical protein
MWIELINKLKKTNINIKKFCDEKVNPDIWRSILRSFPPLTGIMAAGINGADEAERGRRMRLSAIF